MKNVFVHPLLASPNTIRVMASKEVELDKVSVRLLVDGKPMILPEIRREKKGSEYLFEFENELELGHSYYLEAPDYGRFPLDVRNATTFPGFDEKYFYDGELGAIYSKEKTVFRLWAPLASKVVLKLKKPCFAYENNQMKRQKNGIFEITIKGDLDGYEYLYEVSNNEIPVLTTDPYAKGSTANGATSVVLNFAKLIIKKERGALPAIHNYVDAIIYEGNVRDLTIGRHTNIANKGKFLGLIEEDRTTEGGHPAGLSYFKMLGFTHIQLLPISDFKTVDEENPEKAYNWGYDPSQYFVPEGSYSTNPNNPESRVIEAQKMVEGLHKAGIRVIQDVVFNHVYDYLDSSFEKTTPNYYFRKTKEMKMANTSWCGDDLASEKPMVRKMIVDACKWWIDFYGIDGFRFDLMGILDVQTVKEIARYGKAKDPSFMVYGEGWNMGCDVKEPLANMENHKMMPEFAFFNDGFRESIKRYVSGDAYSKDDYKYSILGSCIEWAGKGKRFDSLNQTINYVECHDNWTYHDFLEHVKGQMSKTERLNRCKLALASVLFSFGIPFIHAGQETAQSKFGVENSYNSGDAINKFSWALLDQRWDMAVYFKDLIKVRKNMAILHSSSIFSLLNNVDFFDDGDYVFFRLLVGENKEICVIVNPTNKNMNYTFPEDQTLIFTSGGLARSTNTRVANVLIPKQSFVIVANY